MCPIKGCTNFGERGYARSTFVRHINNFHTHIILADDTEREKVLEATEDLGKFGWCRLCGKLNVVANAQLYCKKCFKLNAKYGAVNQKLLSNEEKNRLTDNIRKANETQITIMNEVPNLMSRYWSKCVTTTLDLFTSALTDEEAFSALEAWTKLKSVLVLPLRGGHCSKKVEI